MENVLTNGDAWTKDIQFNTKQFALPTLSDVGRILQDEMKPMFSELNIDVTACPCLTREPFNLAGVGLCGNTSLIEIGGYQTFIPSPRYDTAKWDISTLLSNFCYDSFIIGAGFAAQPYMPYNGHLIMNAMYKAPTNITNASRIIFADANSGQRRIETLTDPKQMICSFMGNFFLSEGRPGNVIRVRAKGRKCDLDIITIMQDILYRHFYLENDRTTIGLGGILRIKNGRVAVNITPEKYPNEILICDDLARWYECHDINLESDLIAVGTLINFERDFFYMERRYGYPLPSSHHQFHCFSNYGAGGNFISDITKDATEYEGYFNLASKIYFVE